MLFQKNIHTPSKEDRDFIKVLNRTATGFHRQAKLFDLNFVTKKKISTR